MLATAATAQVSSVTLGLGEDVSCTFVNDDDAPSLTLLKTVTNDNGGTSVASDWTLTAAGYDAVPRRMRAATACPSRVLRRLHTDLADVLATAATPRSAAVTLGLGEDVSCTFVNDDDAPSLTLVKDGEQR